MPTPGSAHTHGPGLAQLDANIDNGITLRDDSVKETTHSPAELAASVSLPLRRLCRAEQVIGRGAGANAYWLLGGIVLECRGAVGGPVLKLDDVGKPAGPLPVRHAPATGTLGQNRKAGLPPAWVSR